MKQKFLVICLTLVMGVINAPLADASVLGIQDFKTEKGIRVWLVEDKTVPVISLQFLFLGAGSINDPQDKQGLSQILSNTLDEGAGDLDAKSFQEQLTDQSIGLSFNSSRDDFGGSLKTLTKYQEDAFNLLHLALSKPRFEDDALRRMKDANMARIKSSVTDPDWLAARLFNAELFKDHPYAMNSGGTLSTLPRITADDLRNKLENELGRDRLIVAVAGNINKEDLAKHIDTVFGGLPETSKVRDEKHIEFRQFDRPVQFKKDIPQTVIQMAMAGLSHDDTDYFTAQIVNYILGGAGFGSRLTEEVREKRGLTYGIYSSMSDMNDADLFTIGTSTRTEGVAEVLDLINKELTRMAHEKVSMAELGDAKSYLVGSVPLALTSTDKIAAMMIGFQKFNLPTDYLDRRETALKAVTQDDVLRVSARLFGTSGKPAPRLIAMVGQVVDPDKVTIIEKIPDID